MIPIKEAKKIPFEELDQESQDYYFRLFKRYAVRKQIADTNKELSSMFAKKLKTTNARSFSNCFNDFNSFFANYNLIRDLNQSEISGTFLREMSEAEFNAYLSQSGNSFVRKLGLICHSDRPSERIPNRLDFPAMQAYANMQTLVLENAKIYPNSNLAYIFDKSANQMRMDFSRRNGYPLNQSQIAVERTDYKSLGKKCAPIWKSMLEYYMRQTENSRQIDILSFISQNFVFTNLVSERYFSALDKADADALKIINFEREYSTEKARRFPEYFSEEQLAYVLSDATADQILNYTLSFATKGVFLYYLSDPIFAPKQEKTKS